MFRGTFCSPEQLFSLGPAASETPRVIRDKGSCVVSRDATAVERESETVALPVFSKRDFPVANKMAFSDTLQRSADKARVIGLQKSLSIPLN